MVKAIKTAFQESAHSLCTHHLKQNVIQILTDDAVTKLDRFHLVETIFGTDGIVGADDSICFNGKCMEFESQSRNLKMFSNI